MASAFLKASVSSLGFILAFETRYYITCFNIEASYDFVYDISSNIVDAI